MKQVVTTLSQSNNGLRLNADDFELVRYYLTSQELSCPANIHAYDEYVLREALKRRDKKMVHFLLSSPELREHADINYGKGSLLRSFLEDKGEISWVKYLLTDKRLKTHLNLHADGDRLIILAASYNNDLAIKFFFQKGLIHGSVQLGSDIVSEFVNHSNFEMLAWLWTHPAARDYCHYMNNEAMFNCYTHYPSDLITAFIAYVVEKDKENIQTLKDFYEKSKNQHALKIMEIHKTKQKLEKVLPLLQEGNKKIKKL